MPSRSTLARLQQALTLWTLACALVWLAAWWPHSQALALAGFFGITMGYAAVLGLEFLLLVRVRAGDPTPPARAGELVGAWLREIVMAWRVFAWRQPFRWRAVQDHLQVPGGRHGVVLVHGFVCNRGFWTPWLQRLRAQDRACVAVNLEPVFAPIDAYVPCVQEAVERVRRATGLPPVLVCHSMGGLVARAWLRAQSGVAAHVVTLGSPHAGTWLARFSHTANGRQMRPGSAWIRSLEDHESRQRASRQPGARFTCWYSNSDNIVMPPAMATLPGADNRLVRGAAHVDLAFRPEVIDETLDLIARLDAMAATSVGDAPGS